MYYPFKIDISIVELQIQIVWIDTVKFEYGAFLHNDYITRQPQSAAAGMVG